MLKHGGILMKGLILTLSVFFIFTFFCMGTAMYIFLYFIKTLFLYS